VRRTTHKSYLTLLAFLFSILIGIAASAPAAAAGFPVPDRLRYPPLQYEPPHAERIALDNGIVLYFLEDHELPLVTVNALIRTGTMYDPPGKEGTADLTSSLMKTGGTQKLGSTEMDEQLDLLAASPSITCALDSAQITFSLSSKDVDHGLDLLSQLVITPAFEQEKFRLAKELKNEELRRFKDDPQRLAFREFNRLIYRNDPRGRFASLQSIKKIERGDLVAFHKEFFRPANIMLAVTGDITREAALSKINQYFGSWQSSGTSLNSPVPMQETRGGLFYINREIPQSTIISGQSAPGKSHPDYYAFTVLDFIVGSGGFPSRIFSAVRNNEGLAYSAGSFYRPRTGHGIFAAYAFTKTASTFKTLSLIDSIIEDTPVRTITGKEIDWARKSINNGFIFSFTSPGQIAWQQMKVEYDRLPRDFLATFRKKIEAVTIDDLNEVARKYLDRKNRIVLILGDIKKIGEPSIDIGKPVFIAPED
jgi:zinc protease